MISNKYKIAIDIRELKYKKITGIGRFLRLFLDNLSLEDKQKICLIADKHTDISDYKNYFKVITINAPFTLWYDQISLPHTLHRYSIDIFFSPYYKMPLWGKFKKIVTIHDVHFSKIFLRKGISRFKPYSFFLKLIIRCADKIITVSEFSKNELIKLFKASPNKIKVVYNGIDNKFKVLDRENFDLLRSKYTIDFKYILYVGNLKKHKNIQSLVEAYNLLSEEEKKSYKLIIVAKQEEGFKCLQSTVKKFSLENNIYFLDFVEDNDLVLFYNFAEMFIFPSYYEGFGLPPLEAMTCGTPVISSYTTSLKEILGESALYIDPDNTQQITEKIQELLNSPGLRNSLIEKGKVHVQEFSSTKFAARLYREIEEV